MTTERIDPSRELVVNRVFHAPRDLVLRMWREPNMITQWWGPQGFSTTTHEIDFRSGGTWRFTTRGPDGREFANHVRYVEVQPGRIVFEHGSVSETTDFTVEVKLEEVEPGRTRMEFRSIFPSADDLRRAVDEFGADQGLNETTTRLDSLLANVLSHEDPFRLVTSLPSPTEIRLVRSFHTKRECVFAAFTKCEHIQNWQGPVSYSCRECHYEPWVGGKWILAHEDPDGDIWHFRGEILEFDAPTRIVSTFGMDGTSSFDHQTTTSFDEWDGVTRVTIRSAFPTERDRDRMLESGMERAMSQGFQRLDALIEASKRVRQEATIRPGSAYTS